VSGQRFWVGVIVIVVAGLAARIGLMWSLREQPLADPDNYVTLARSVAHGDGLRMNGRLTAYRPPLYPLLLAPGLALNEHDPRAYVITLNLGLGAITIMAVVLASQSWGFSRWSSLLAGCLVALDPVLVSQSTAAMTETLSTALVSVLLCLLGPFPRLARLILTGFIAGLACLSRPSLAPAVLLIAALLGLLSPGGMRRRIASTGVFVVSLTLTIAPWVIRNTLLFHEPVWTTTHGGYTFALANNRAYYDDVVRGPAGSVWSGANQAQWFEEINQLGAGLPEPSADRLFYRVGFQTARERPRDFLWACLGRLGRFWAIAPSERVYSRGIRWLTVAWTLPFWLLVCNALMRRDSWRWPVVAAVAVPLALTIVHSLYWTDLRMRAPAVPALALLAGSGLSRWSHGRGLGRIK
jgi:hypothetical protein